MGNVLRDFWPWLLSAASFALAAAATIHILMWKRDSRAAIGWTGLVWLAPLVGAFVYFSFGINRIQRRAISLGLKESWRPETEIPPTPQEVAHRDELTSHHPNLVGLAAAGRRLTGRRIAPGNRIDLLVNGDEAFPAMLAAIEHAERSISLLTYIFESDHVGNEFFGALVRAHQRGVEVRVLIDDVGSRYGSPNMVARLQAVGLQAAAFLPTRVPRLFKYANLRNHRKLLVADGRVGFTGGTNLRAGHRLAHEPPHPVQCIHFRLEGPVVRQLQEAFAIDWAFATGESLGGDTWFPPLERAGSVWARGISDGPDEDFEKLTDMLMAAVTAAREQVWIATPYFLPETPLIRALIVAALRDVDVRILLPAKNNIPVVHWASTALWWQLLEKGCRIFLTPPPFDHTKLLVVDNAWALIGSTNWDPRSLRLNFEFNVECYDEALARQLVQLAQQKLGRAREVTLEEVDGRTFLARLRDGAARLLTPYL